MTIDSIAALNTEMALRASTANLQFECGCGGNLSAEIAIISEYPGTVELATKRPLSGNTGKILFDMLRRYNITRDKVFITNVIKRKITTAVTADGRSKHVTVPQAEFDHWRSLLLDELSFLPNVRFVFAIGGHVLRALLGETSITHWRGSVVDLDINKRPVSVLFANNPAVIFNDPKQEIVFKMDCGKLDRMVRGLIQCPQFEEVINPTLAESLDYIDFCARTDEAISLDIETMGGETACVGLAHSNTYGMCINLRGTDFNRFTVSEERQLLVALQRLYNTPNRKFITQNGGYDASWLWFKDRVRMPPIWHDTLLAHHTLYPPLPHNLGFLTAQYTDHPYYKDDLKNWGESGDIDTFWRYNCKDVCITRIIAFEQIKELEAQKLDQFFYSHVMRLQPHLVSMTVNGVLCDRALKDELTVSIGADVDRKRQIFIESARKATGNSELECNPNSPRDLGKLFFNDLRLVGRGSSTNDENRKRIAAHPRTPNDAKLMLGALDEYKSAHKFFSTYVKSGLDPDDRFRCEYKQFGVASAPGRLSSSKTSWDTGMNLQNQPEEAKPMFVADPGYEFTYFDAAQIEARIVAWKAKIATWKQQFELARLNPGSYDAHCALAADMYKVPYDEVPKFDVYPDDWPDIPLRGKRTMRYVAKRCRHGLNYRMGPDKLATTAELSMREAEEAWHVYHRTTPEVQQWWSDTTAEVRRTGRLYNAFGRRWILLERFDDSALESIVAFYPQSTAGDHITRCIYLCHDDPRWPRTARIVLNIHDALIALHRIEDREIVHAIMKQHGETPIYVDGEELIVPVDFARSQPDEKGIHRWSTLKKIK